MSAALWAIGSDLPVKVLAIAGGAAVGAFVVGWLVQVLATTFGQKVPPSVLGLVRVGAGLGCGLIVAFWMFGAGGGFGGGSGGGGLFGGAGTGKGKATEQPAPRATGQQGTGTPGQGGPAGTLTLQILGDDDLKRYAAELGPSANFSKRYRFEKGGKPGLFTREEALAEIEARSKDKERPVRKVKIRTYRDSPVETRLRGLVQSFAEDARKYFKSKGDVIVDPTEAEFNPAAAID